MEPKSKFVKTFEDFNKIKTSVEAGPKDEVVLVPKENSLYWNLLSMIKSKRSKFLKDITH